MLSLNQYFIHVGLEMFLSLPHCPPSPETCLVEPCFKEHLIVISKIIISTLCAEG